ncbi:uncharacterized protein LOC122503337 [Leptopilina heterotoma]|uniref:uncharacterized protein LOC122503337 n=1 Tax=Leptopilina heterotoma TaxID=63436 RepID=UPI001CA9AA8B|nr:uncharacterized protein LOC122503337 [Leptopilina heterotoma]
MSAMIALDAHVLEKDLMSTKTALDVHILVKDLMSAKIALDVHILVKDLMSAKIALDVHILVKDLMSAKIALDALVLVKSLMSAKIALITHILVKSLMSAKIALLHAREKSQERKVRYRRSRSREQRHKRKDRSRRSRSPKRTDDHNRRDTFISETEHNSFSDTSRYHVTDREYESSDTEKNISFKSIDNMKDFMEGDVQLSEKTLHILGDNSKGGNPDHAKVHNVLLTKWTDILQNGLIKETLDEVLKKLPFPKEFEAIAAPLVDPEFKYSLGESGLKKDNFQIISQNKIGAAMYAIALALTIIFNDGCKVDLKITQYLSDAGRILGDVHYNVSIMRRAFILPKVNQTVKEISDGLPISKFLFGEELISRMKAAKAVEKSSKDLMRPSTSGVKFKRSNQRSQPKKTHTPNYKRTPTNWRGSNRGGYKSRNRGNLDGPKKTNRPYRRQY